jgi:ABC-type multidrug transport system permease subunit
MLRLGLKLLFSTFNQLIIVIIAYHFYFRYAMATGGIGGTIFGNIHYLIWIILFIELIISGILIIKSFKK